MILTRLTSFSTIFAGPAVFPRVGASRRLCAREIYSMHEKIRGEVIIASGFPGPDVLGHTGVTHFGPTTNGEQPTSDLRPRTSGLRPQDLLLPNFLPPASDVRPWLCRGSSASTVDHSFLAIHAYRLSSPNGCSLRMFKVEGPRSEVRLELLRLTSVLPSWPANLHTKPRRMRRNPPGAIPLRAGREMPPSIGSLHITISCWKNLRQGWH